MHSRKRTTVNGAMHQRDPGLNSCLSHGVCFVLCLQNQTEPDRHTLAGWFLQGAYRAVYSYLRNDGMCRVVGIPEDQLKIASLGKARLDKGYPSAQKVISYGVPRGLATALAPFQRGGVEFVVEKEGRALIADGACCVALPCVSVCCAVLSGLCCAVLCGSMRIVSCRAVWFALLPLQGRDGLL